jgi:tripartite-type tricarboxylate transporter receptor subunit TctC
MRFTNVLAALCAPLVFGLAAPLHAADYPTRPVRILVGTAPGGAVDIVGRILAPKLAQTMGQAFVLENHPGPYTAQKEIADAVPDGYTLMIGSTTITTIPAMYPDARINPEKDATAISLIADTPIMLVCRPGFAAQNVAELLKMASAHPGKLTYASAGTGSPPHLSGELFKSVTGLNILHVPYKGVSPALIDVAAGRVDLMFASYGSVLPFLKSGRVRILASTAEQRFALQPNVPTFKELGYPNMVFASWTGIIAPPKTPPAIVNALNGAIVKTLHDKSVVDTLMEQGFTPVSSTPEDFGVVIKNETSKIGKIVSNAGIKPD